jgi:hypothetical protein
VESSCKFGIEPSGSVKCGKLSSLLMTGCLSSSAQLHGVSLFSHMLEIRLCEPCSLAGKLHPHVGAY